MDVRQAEAILQIEKLKIDFGSGEHIIHAVKEISFELNKGEVLAIVGETGCGKTVLCKSILGLLSKKARVTQGKILFDGLDLLQLSQEKLNQVRGKEIALVFQDSMSVLDPVVSIGKQIEESIKIHRKFKGKERKEKVLDLLKKVDIDEPERRYYQYPFQLSGGMRQRCVIASALSCSPRILIADEPTTALDVTVQAEIIELLQQLQRDRELSVLLITHDLGVVAQIADRVIVMKDGEMVEEGKVEQIFYKPLHSYTKQLLDSVKSCSINGNEEIV